jgi:hypothetical protein
LAQNVSQLIFVEINTQLSPWKNSPKIKASGIRVTRLGEFSPIGLLFSLGSLLKITEVAQHSGLLFSSFQFIYKFWQKMAWATIWAIFSQTHLVIIL